MHKGFTLLMWGCAMATCAFCGDGNGAGTRHGTINVAIANDNGIVVLTDSMLTETSRDARGVPHYRQLPQPAQKLFLIDDKTVCTFAGFASAPTDSIPDFLNNVPAIIGRYQDSLNHYKNPLTFSEKLDLLEDIVGYYLTGIANIRDGSPADDYTFQLFLAGYDVDGTAKLGRLELETVSESTRGGLSLLRSVAREKVVFPILHNQILCLNGIPNVARNILDSSHVWTSDPGACVQSMPGQESLPIDKMKELAIDLKQQTADRYPQVGGPSQIAVLKGGRAQRPLEQPAFPPIKLSGFEFQIVSTISSINEDKPGMPKSSRNPAIISDLFTLYFADLWINAGQELDNAYFAKNSFKDSRLMYRGGKTHLDRSNQIIDCDLEIAKGVSRKSPVVKQLVRDFEWRTVTYDVQMTPVIR